MKEIEALLGCRDNLFRYAWSKLRNTEESNDLVADTIFKVLTDIKMGNKMFLSM